jgi:hypothetical protein
MFKILQDGSEYQIGPKRARCCFDIFGLKSSLILEKVVYAPMGMAASTLPSGLFHFSK